MASANPFVQLPVCACHDLSRQLSLLGAIATRCPSYHPLNIFAPLALAEVTVMRVELVESLKLPMDVFDPRRVGYCGSKDECPLFEDDVDRLNAIRDA
jgi:hypothetical protein